MTDRDRWLQRQSQFPRGWQWVRLRELIADEIQDAVYDLKAVNPNAKGQEDTRTPEELLDLIEAKGREIAEALALLRSSSRMGIP